MSFIYNRTVSINRPYISTGAGVVGYSGELPTTETVILTGLPAALQQRVSVRSNQSTVPGDVQTSGWFVFLPASVAALGQIMQRDIVIDDLGQRYVIVAAYWNSLGYKLTCMILTT